MYEDYVPSNLQTWTERVLHHLGRKPDELALVEATANGARTWSRAEFRRMTAGAVELIHAEHVPDGMMVPALLTTRPESVAMLLAGALTGRPLAPLAPRMTQSELLACLERIPGDILVAEAGTAEMARLLGPPTGKRVVVVDGNIEGKSALQARHDPRGVAMVMHSSGTTGMPKQIEVPEFALGRRADVNGYLLRLRRGDRYVATSLFHHMGGMGNIAVPMGNGAAVVLFPAFSVAAWRSLEPAAPTHCVTIPSVLEMLLDADALASSSIRVLGYGAAPIHPETMRRIQKVMPTVHFVNLFGQTEGSPVSVLLPEDHRAAAAGRTELLRSVGRASPGCELRIHNPDSDGVGEVWARSPHSFVVDGEGWQHTGDLGRLDDEGYLFLVGRLGDKIIRGGENVYPLEVEHVLQTHPSVRDVVVVGVPDRRLGETIRAYIVPEGPAPDRDALRRYARERLAGFKVPVSWEYLEEMPRNPNGKILRRVLTNRAAVGATSER
jgi:acyl-CoA synthetase (AMP-forming)/AMP-acid ligase II